MPIPLHVTPLGTASAIPTRARHLSATALGYEGDIVLFDCGESTQFQLLRAGLKRSRIRAICITHFHGDHLYGLMGLMTTMALMQREEPLTLVAPAGLYEITRGLPGLRADHLPYRTEYVELGEGFLQDPEAERVVLDRPAWRILARPLSHRVPCMGFRFEEKTRPGKVNGAAARALGVTEGAHFEALKRGRDVTLPDGTVARAADLVGPERPGRSFAYCLDTAPCPGAVGLAQGANLVLHEATFTEELAGRAQETGHSTALQAARTAAEAGARRLLLTHFSARYDSTRAHVDEARTVFPNTQAAEELERYDLARSASPSAPPPVA